MADDLNRLHVAVVILNYNSEKDLCICAEQLSKQKSVALSIILVDNDSQSTSLVGIKSWLAEWCRHAVCGTVDEVYEWVERNSESADNSGGVFLIESNENRGYSSGNNIGIKLADKLNVDAVLIANPDMRFNDPYYLEKLTIQLFSDPQYYIAASRIVGLDDADQNPLREASFWEEFFWPRWVLRRLFKPSSYILSFTQDTPITVPKVSGCCMLLSMDFLRKTNYLDDNVFLYCEEPILSARVHTAGGKIIFVPSVSAVHAHVSSEKGNQTKRMLLFIKSRKYYLKTYSGYNRWQLIMLACSYALFGYFNQLKGLCKRVVSSVLGLRDGV